MTMIERVARALYEDTARPIFQKWEDAIPENRDSYLRASRAAIEAMREPTDAMRKALLCHREGGCGDDALYHIVIDAALNEQVAG